MTLILRDYQSESVEALRDNIRKRVRNQVLCAPTGAGKCLGFGTPILMADGSIKPVQEVVAGDALMGPDGMPRNVLSTTTGKEPMYRITPKKGMSYTVNASHILSLRKTPGSDGINLSDGSYVAEDDDVVNLNVEVFARSNATARHCLKGWRSPAIASFMRDEDEFTRPIPPYILGAWLGDGSIGRACISKPPCNMVNEWIEYGKSVGYGVRHDQGSADRCDSWHLTEGTKGNGYNTVKGWLDITGVLYNKHIPEDYKYAPLNDRLELLAGMIDSDGHINHSGCDWISKSEQMADDFAFVCRSVGLSCYISRQQKGIAETGFSGWYWRASVSGDLSILPMRDKKCPARTQKKRHLVHGITIEPIGVGDYYGFEIDGDRLFLLGDFTVTHNTIISAFLLDECLNKGKRALFVADRIALIDQTSATLDKYGISHGVIQGQHWRYRPYERIQVASAQTLARRVWPDADMLIVDECHALQKTVTDRIAKRDVVTIGLSATPFTRGLGVHYDAVVSVTTTNKLTEAGHLVPFRVFAASQPDMTGAKVVAGEWAEDDAAERAMPIVGDCVAEYLKHGDGKKFIAFGCNVAHCEALQKQFMAAGVMTELYTYRTGDDARTQIVEEFRKPDSYIRGLVSISALSKGFDVSDVEVIIMARPLRKSLSEHIQILGRGLRPHEGKRECLVLDHAGNMERFWVDMNDFFEASIHELDDGKPKPEKKAKEKKEKEPVKCPQCKCVHAPMPVCPACGHAYPKRQSDVEHMPGELLEFGGVKAKREDKQSIYSQLLYIQRAKGYNEHWLSHKYKEKFGVWPRGMADYPLPPSFEVQQWVKSRAIAWAKSQRK